LSLGELEPRTPLAVGAKMGAKIGQKTVVPRVPNLVKKGSKKGLK
jgi:hypothetical protein